MRKGDKLPDVTFKTRVLGEWEDKTTADYFANKRVILFSLPGAFTPTCSTYQLPNYEKMFPEFQELGIDAIYCMSVNDAFVMNAWADNQELRNVQVIPDGSGKFTKEVGMLVTKDNLGFGSRSWRYAVVVDNGVVEMWFGEASQRNEADDDPYEISSPENVIQYCRNRQAQAA